MNVNVPTIKTRTIAHITHSAGRQIFAAISGSGASAGEYRAPTRRPASLCCRAADPGRRAVRRILLGYPAVMPPAGRSSGETSANGQCASHRQGRATGPMACGGCRGCGLGRVVPRTSNSARADRSSSARTGRSFATSAISRPVGRTRGRCPRPPRAAPGGTAVLLGRHPGRRRDILGAQAAVAVVRADQMDGGVAQPRFPYRPAHGSVRGGRPVDADHDPTAGWRMRHGPPPAGCDGIG